MKISREEFLKTRWRKYPAVKQSALDVASALFRFRSDEAGRLAGSALYFAEGSKQVIHPDQFNRSAVVGGRLEIENAQTYLSSGGERVAILLENALWAESDEVLDQELLKAGDVLLVKAKFSLKPLSLKAETVQLLSPNLADTPAKHNSSEIAMSKKWARYTQAVREYFVMHDFIECQTPSLVVCPGTEPYLDPFSTELEVRGKRRTLFLPTSPEFHLKKMLARGWTKIFEIRSCFRNGEMTEHHQPEFQMLEWYRAYDHLDTVIDDIRSLLKHIESAFLPEVKIPDPKVISLAELFKTACDFELKPNTSHEELLNLCKSLKINVSSSDTWDDLFFRLILEKIEPSLDSAVPTIVRGYPTPQAALSRIRDDGWADRFELYWQGLEIANAFHELNDPEQNKKRFKDDLSRKLASGRQAIPLDEELIESFYAGMPPAGGIALGMERLFMALFKVQNIAKLKPFTLS